MDFSRLWQLLIQLPLIAMLAQLINCGRCHGLALGLRQGLAQSTDDLSSPEKGVADAVGEEFASKAKSQSWALERADFERPEAAPTA